MNNFNYYSPCNIYFGKDTENNIGALCKKLSVKKVLLHYGGGSIKKNGLYYKVTECLKKENIEFLELPGVEPNPKLSLALKGIELCKKENIDFVLAVGGGSVIDSAKCIASGYYYDNIWEYYLDGSKTIEKALPIGVVLTIPAAGSETSPNSVITEEKSKLKRSIESSAIIPKFSIINPENTFSLPKNQIANGVSDIIAHLFERYFSQTENVDLTDRLLESAIITMLKYGKLTFDNPENYDIRAEAMWSGTLAHNGILSQGRTEDWASHSIEHELSAEYNIAHGAGLSIVFPAWMKYVYKENIGRFLQFSRRVFNVDYGVGKEELTITETIKKLEKFYKSLNLPIKLSEVNINDDKIDEMTERLFYNRSEYIGNFKKLNKEDVKNIYRLAL
ncbi:iron-containing alcohol dehydrogenase [Brachyspira pilosicoli]|uniref:iron-containing alcohol dehydrogenase n=1 Tax=Brachyspira pilosicoli TaxID=52584 RepID=UPI0012F482E2|nr:iron-containing alcohol dehydrogenase [Brachyspira pilosicoli]